LSHRTRRRLPQGIEGTEIEERDGRGPGAAATPDVLVGNETLVRQRKDKGPKHGNKQAGSRAPAGTCFSVIFAPPRGLQSEQTLLARQYENSSTPVESPLNRHRNPRPEGLATSHMKTPPFVCPRCFPFLLRPGALGFPVFHEFIWLALSAGETPGICSEHFLGRALPRRASGACGTGARAYRETKVHSRTEFGLNGLGKWPPPKAQSENRCPRGSWGYFTVPGSWPASNR